MHPMMFRPKKKNHPSSPPPSQRAYRQTVAERRRFPTSYCTLRYFHFFFTRDWWFLPLKCRDFGWEFRFLQALQWVIFHFFAHFFGRHCVLIVILFACTRLQTVGVSNQETGHSLSVSSSTVWAEDSDLGLGRICRDFMGKLRLKPAASDTNRAAKTGIYLTAHSQFPP